MERDSCQRQYDALYKLHQEAADNLANLSNEKQRFETFFYSVNPMRLSYFVNESIENLPKMKNLQLVSSPVL